MGAVVDGGANLNMLAEFFDGENLKPVEFRATLATNDAEPTILDDEIVQVTEFELRESISEPYELSVTLSTDDLAFDIDGLVGGALDLEIERPGRGARIVQGIIERAEYVRTFSRRVFFRLRVVPAFALLRYSKRRRIFQDQTVVEIVQEVCKPVFERYSRELDADRLTQEYPRREYCVQMDESDLEFAQRILSEDGIWFGFDADGSFEKLVLLDAASVIAPVGGALLEDAGGEPPALPVIPQRAEEADQSSVQYFGRRRTVATATFQQRAFDWKSLPTAVLDTLYVDDDDPTLVGEEDVFAPLRLLEGDAGEGPHLDRTGDLVGFAAQRGESRRVRARGVANEIGIFAGSKFELTHHPHPDLDGVYVVLSVTHRGAAPDALGAASPLTPSGYSCEFECQPDLLQIRTPRRARPRVAGPHTAIVVGPAGEEIHTDHLGRVRVQMHWDAGRDVELTTAWLRVAQAWAGAGFGTLFLPRIGMEVVVSFIDGDPARPMVTGCVYNGANPTPVTLPDNKTCSTIRTQSSPGGDGFNELKFEDAAGNEEIFLHAERNLRETIKSCHNTSVGADQSLTVGKDQTVTVKGDQISEVKKHRTHTVGESNSEIVNGPDDEAVHGTKTLMVTEEYLVDVTQRIVFTCGPTQIELTPTGISIQTPLTYNVTVGGTTFDMNPAQLIGRALATELHAATSCLTLNTEATMQSAVMAKTVCGDSHLTLDGKATLFGANTVVEGDSMTEILSSGMCKVEASVATVNGTTSTTISGGTTTSIDGGGALIDMQGGIAKIN